jgi:hypothetical protein
MANEHKSIINVTNESTAFLELLNFTGNFTLSWEENYLSVIKLTSKRLSCYDEKKFQSHEYKVDKENGSFVVKTTGKIFSLEDYTLIKEEGGNITLCRKLLLSNCNESSFVPLNPDEYVVFHNLTVYHNATESVFNFGEYLISERKQNLLICAKLATLVGFPWLIALIGVLFPNVEAFEYLFVIFVCLQGLYIAMAFLFNKKTLKLYKDRWNIGSRGNASSYTPTQTFEMT